LPNFQVWQKAVDDKSEVCFSIPQGGRCHGSQFLLVVYGCRWAQAASGAAGRANVERCPVSTP